VNRLVTTQLDSSNRRPGITWRRGRGTHHGPLRILGYAILYDSSRPFGNGPIHDALMAEATRHWKSTDDRHWIGYFSYDPCRIFEELPYGLPRSELLFTPLHSKMSPVQFYAEGRTTKPHVGPSKIKLLSAISATLSVGPRNTLRWRHLSSQSCTALFRRFDAAALRRSTLASRRYAPHFYGAFLDFGDYQSSLTARTFPSCENRRVLTRPKGTRRAKVGMEIILRDSARTG